MDLYVAFNRIGSNSYEFMIPYLVMALIYIVIVLVITLGIKLMETEPEKSDKVSDLHKSYGKLEVLKA